VLVESDPYPFACNFENHPFENSNTLSKLRARRGPAALAIMATPQAAQGAPGSGQQYPIVRGDFRREKREALETVPGVGGALLYYTVRYGGAASAPATHTSRQLRRTNALRTSGAGGPAAAKHV
jgi:hypothetical protein